MSEIFTEKLGACDILSITEYGAAHKNSQYSNQDSLLYKRTSDGNYVFAVADGVSSCKKAKEGSSAAVQAVCELAESMEIMTPSTLKQEIYSLWKSKIQGNWNEYGTTLNFAYISGEKIILGRIGDGIACASVNSDNFIILQDDSVFYSNETFAFGEYFPISAFETRESQLAFNDSVDIVLMTDGVSKELDLQSMPDLLNYLSSRRNETEFLGELENWIVELNRKNDDDKTLLFVHIER